MLQRGSEFHSQPARTEERKWEGWPVPSHLLDCVQPSPVSLEMSAGPQPSSPAHPHVEQQQRAPSPPSGMTEYSFFTSRQAFAVIGKSVHWTLWKA